MQAAQGVSAAASIGAGVLEAHAAAQEASSTATTLRTNAARVQLEGEAEQERRRRAAQAELGRQRAQLDASGVDSPQSLAILAENAAQLERDAFNVGLATDMEVRGLRRAARDAISIGRKKQYAAVIKGVAGAGAAYTPRR